MKNNFHLDYLHEATLVGELELPLLRATEAIPRNVFSYSEIKGIKNPNECYIDFFVDDYRFEKLKFLPYFDNFGRLKKIIRYTKEVKQMLLFIKEIDIFKLYKHLDRVIKKLLKFEGVISPDYSLYPEMPLIMRKWNCFISRVVAYYMQCFGINIIPSVAWAMEEDFSYCFDGIPENSSVAISLNGCKSCDYSKKICLLGIEELQRVKKPKHLIICGKPFPELSKYNNIISYPSFSQRKCKRQREAQMKRDGQLNFSFMDINYNKQQMIVNT